MLSLLLLAAVRFCFLQLFGLQLYSPAAWLQPKQVQSCRGQRTKDCTPVPRAKASLPILMFPFSSSSSSLGDSRLQPEINSRVVGFGGRPQPLTIQVAGTTRPPNQVNDAFLNPFRTGSGRSCTARHIHLLHQAAHIIPAPVFGFAWMQEGCPAAPCIDLKPPPR